MLSVRDRPYQPLMRWNRPSEALARPRPNAESPGLSAYAPDGREEALRSGRLQLLNDPDVALAVARSANVRFWHLADVWLHACQR
jgi:hypothetical protein